MEKDSRLRNSAEFRAVYSRGRRFDGPLISVFFRANGLGRHRFGITASRKMAKRAVDRNRAKRVIREAFRLNRLELGSLRDSYDWVVNARRAVVEVKSDVVSEEFRRVILQVRAIESEISARA